MWCGSGLLAGALVGTAIARAAAAPVGPNVVYVQQAPPPGVPYYAAAPGGATVVYQQPAPAYYAPPAPAVVYQQQPRTVVYMPQIGRAHV